MSIKPIIVSLVAVLLGSSCQNDITYPSAGPFVPSSYGVPDGEDIRRFDDTTNVRAIVTIQHRINNLIDTRTGRLMDRFVDHTVYQQFHDGLGSARDKRFFVVNSDVPFSSIDVNITRPKDTILGLIDFTIRPDPYLDIVNLSAGDTIRRDADLHLEFNEPGSRWINIELVRDLTDSDNTSTIETHRRSFIAAPRVEVSRDVLSMLPSGWITITVSKHQVVFRDSEYNHRIAFVFETQQRMSLFLR